MTLNELKENLFMPLVEALKDTYGYRFSERHDVILTFFINRCYVSITVMCAYVGQDDITDEYDDDIPGEYDNEAIISYSDRRVEDGYADMGCTTLPVANVNEIVDLVKGTLK